MTVPPRYDARPLSASGSGRLRALVRLAAAALVLLFAGCVSASREEDRSLARVQEAGARLRPAGRRPELPALTADAPLADYLRYALLNHPQVEAAFDDWRGAVLAIAPARALPDPQFTFQADIADTVMSFMPGLMFDFMAPGKRAAMGREATAAGQVAYRTYVARVLGTAADVRKSWIDLAYLDEAIRLRESSVAALEQSLAVADAGYTTGRGMGTLEDPIRFTNETARMRLDLAVLGDRRAAARAKFKSALGLAPTDADPPWPQATLAATTLPDEGELWRRAQAANPELGRMRAMVEMAIAGVDVARKAGTPDFTLGAMVDLKADPLMVRPTATVTLPVWREKIRAQLGAAEARRDAAVARVSAEQLDLAAELAQMLSMVREDDRMIAYIDGTALPNFDRAIATVEAGYQAGMTSLAMIPETRVMALNMRVERIAALRERETAVTDLLLLVANVAPAGAPLPEASAPPPS